jgi:nucleotide-binding universal stress UspA family protein
MVVPQINAILYATDLSESARNAFGYAALLADRFAAKLIIVHAMEEFHPESQIPNFIGEAKWQELKQSKHQEIVDLITQRIDDFCRAAASAMPDCKAAPTKIVVRQGHAVDVILDEQEEKACDVVVLGSHGMGMLADAMMGSTARRVVRRCKKPVLVVRAAD